MELGSQSKDFADTRWVMIWKGAKIAKTVKARVVAEGYQDPDLRNGAVDIAGCVRRRSPHLPLVFPAGVEEMGDVESGYQECLCAGGWL